MAEIVQEPVNNDVGGTLDSLFYIVSNYWWVLVLIGLLIGVIIIAISIWRAKQENDRRRDSAVYATAMNLFESCENNQKTAWVRNYYSLWNLLWLGIPFKRKEHSVKVVDIDRNILGWYRGHARTQEGNEVYLIYKNKSFLGLMEDRFLLYCPKSIRVPVVTIKDGKREYQLGKDGKAVLEIQPLPEDIITFDRNAEEIVVRCNTITKQGNYYRFPSYVVVRESGKQEHIDMTYELANFISKINFIVLAENGFSDMSRAMGKAVELNPFLKYDQKAPDKEKQIDDDENGK